MNSIDIVLDLSQVTTLMRVVANTIEYKGTNRFKDLAIDLALADLNQSIFILEISEDDLIDLVLHIKSLPENHRNKELLDAINESLEQSA